MSSDDVLRQPQLAFDHLFAVLAAVLKHLLGLQAVHCSLVSGKIVLVAKHLAAQPALESLLLGLAIAQAGGRMVIAHLGRSESSEAGSTLERSSF